jgi:hypothetical protein
VFLIFSKFIQIHTIQSLANSYIYSCTCTCTCILYMYLPYYSVDTCLICTYLCVQYLAPFPAFQHCVLKIIPCIQCRLENVGTIIMSIFFLLMITVVTNSTQATPICSYCALFTTCIQSFAIERFL